MSLLTNLISYWKLDGNSSDAVGTYEQFFSEPDDLSTIFDVRTMGQTFTPSISHTITGVSIRAYRVGTPGNVTCNIYATDGSGFPTGGSLTSGTVSANAWTTTTTGIWYDISLGAGTALTASTKYIMVITCAGADSSNCIKWLFLTTGGYSGGEANYALDGSTWVTTTQDRNFQESGSSVSPNNGTDTDISYTLFDFYPESNVNADIGIYSGVITAVGQSFKGIEASLTSVKFWLKKTGSPTGNAVAKLYLATGTLGDDAKPTGSVLATSGNLDVSTLSTSYALKELTFAGYTMTAGTNYVVVFEFTGGDASNSPIIGMDSSSPTHQGNESYYQSSTWSANSSIDMAFYLYGTPNGKINQGAGFNGTTSKIVGSVINLPTNATIACWFKTTDTSTTGYFGFSKNGGAGFYFTLVSTKMYITAYDSDLVNGYANSSDAINDGNWHLAVGEKEGNTVRFYLDGNNLKDFDTVSFTGNFNTLTMAIGYAVKNNTFALGSIDECGYWERLLTSGEKTSLWNGGNGLAYPLTTNVVYTMVTSPASFSYTPQNITPTKTMHLITDKAIFVLTSVSVGMHRAWTMITAPSNYILTMSGVGLKKILHMITAPASFTLTTIAIGLNKTLTMVTAPAHFILTGSVITLTKIWGKITSWSNPHSQSYPRAKEVPPPQPKSTSNDN